MPNFQNPRVAEFTGGVSFKGDTGAQISTYTILGGSLYEWLSKLGSLFGSPDVGAVLGTLILTTTHIIVVV